MHTFCPVKVYKSCRVFGQIVQNHVKCECTPASLHGIGIIVNRISSCLFFNFASIFQRRLPIRIILCVFVLVYIFHFEFKYRIICNGAWQYTCNGSNQLFCILYRKHRCHRSHCTICTGTAAAIIPYFRTISQTIRTISQVQVISLKIFFIIFGTVHFLFAIIYGIYDSTFRVIFDNPVIMA